MAESYGWMRVSRCGRMQAGARRRTDVGRRGKLAPNRIKHCNFLINNGAAQSSDIETLGEIVRRKVLSETGVSLEWEIIRIGEKTQNKMDNLYE